MKKTDNNIPNNYHHPASEQLPDNVLQALDDSERDVMNEIWKQSGTVDNLPPGSLIPPMETEEALREMHARLEFKSGLDKIAGRIRQYGRYMVAALAFIAFGIAYFLVPQTVSAPFGEMSEAQLPDGSVVELNSGATLQFNRLFGTTNRSITLNGEAYFDVVEDSEAFVVKANGTTTEVLGTRFSIRSWSSHPERETKIAVLEGEVLFYPDGQAKKAVTLRENFGSRWSPSLETPEDPGEVDLERVTGWRDQKFIFYEEPLQLIFRELERRFDLEIDLQNQQVSNETLTGYYREVSDPESLIDDICTVAGLNYAKTANGYRIY